jgi:hypothetical protein
MYLLIQVCVEFRWHFEQSYLRYELRYTGLFSSDRFRDAGTISEPTGDTGTAEDSEQGNSARRDKGLSGADTEDRIHGITG